MGPRDPVVQAVALIDWRTGKAVSDQHRDALHQIRQAAEDLLAALHYAEGTQADAERMSTRSMAIAATQIELGVEMAYRAVLLQK